jgi:uncharacterized protein (DUF2249 family)
MENKNRIKDKAQYLEIGNSMTITWDTFIKSLKEELQNMKDKCIKWDYKEVKSKTMYGKINM